MAAASKWRLIRSPRELRSSRMDYIQNIAIGTSARTKTSSSFFFFFTFLVPLCIQKTRDDDVWHGGYYAGMKRVHVVFLLSKRSGVTLCWILDCFNRVCFRTDAIFDDDTTITNASKRRTALFFFLFWIIREISTRWASMERFLSAFLLELRSKTRLWRIRSRFVDISRSRDDMRTANTKSSFSKISTGKQLTLRRRVACFKTFEKMRKKSSDWPNSSFFYS